MVSDSMGPTSLRTEINSLRTFRGEELVSARGEFKQFEIDKNNLLKHHSITSIKDDSLDSLATPILKLELDLLKLLKP